MGLAKKRYGENQKRKSKRWFVIITPLLIQAHYKRTSYKQKENEGKEYSVKKENNHGYPWLGLGFAEKESDR